MMGGCTGLVENKFFADQFGSYLHLIFWDFAIGFRATPHPHMPFCNESYSKKTKRCSKMKDMKLIG
jgi:hypothetical protein